MRCCIHAGVMPVKNDFVRAGRFDITRAVERWGGLYILAEELGYKVMQGRRASSARSLNVAAEAGLGDSQARDTLWPFMAIEPVLVGHSGTTSPSL
jgi:hypothetical protein